MPVAVNSLSIAGFQDCENSEILNLPHNGSPGKPYPNLENQYTGEMNLGIIHLQG